MSKRLFLAVLVCLILPGLARAATASYLNFSTGAPDTYNAIYGSGFGSAPSGNEVLFTDQTTLATYAAPVSSWTDNLIVFRAPFNLPQPTNLDSTDNWLYEFYTVDVGHYNGTTWQSIINQSATIPYSGPLTFELRVPNTATPDLKPHGDFSGSTDFCIECHEVHSGNGTAGNQSPYGLLGYDINAGALTGYTVTPANVVQEVCMTCHQVGGYGGITVGSFATAQPEKPVNPGFGAEEVASDSHYVVYKNGGAQVHPMAASVPPDSVNVTLGYLGLNTTIYQDQGYNGAAPGTTVANGQTVTGLYCGSCHSPHGNYSANAWLGWDAAQFSENYGYNAGGDATTANQIPAPNANPVPTNNLWADFMQNGGQGALPLTNALLIENPGHQNGVQTGASSNPNVPNTSNVPGTSGTSPSPISMNFFPYLTTQTGQHPGFFVNPTVDQQSLGASDDALSNFCMACHNLNGGAEAYIYDYDSGNFDHSAHPLQAFLSPNNAGLPNHYDDTGKVADDGGLFATSTPQSGAYGRILNGCTSCHGSSEALVPTQNIDGTNKADYTNGFSLSFGGFNVNNDFPHTDANTNDNLRLLKYPPDGLCLSCHDNQPGDSSLP